MPGADTGKRATHSSTDHSPVTSTRPHPLRKIVTRFHGGAAVPALFFVLAGSIFSAFAGVLGVAAAGSFAPEPDDYLTEYEAASLATLVGIQKLAVFAAVGMFAMTAAMFFVGAVLVTALHDRR